MKRCCTCKAIKSLDEFNNNRAYADGKQKLCRTCHRESCSKSYYKKTRTDNPAAPTHALQPVKESSMFSVPELLPTDAASALGIESAKPEKAKSTKPRGRAAMNTENLLTQVKQATPEVQAGILTALLRGKIGLTQTEVGEMVGTTQYVVSAFERGNPKGIYKIDDLVANAIADRVLLAALTAAQEQLANA